MFVPGHDHAQIVTELGLDVNFFGERLGGGTVIDDGVFRRFDDFVVDDGCAVNVGGAGFTRTVVIGLFGGLVVGVFGREGGDAFECLFNCRYVVEHEHMVVRKK